MGCADSKSAGLANSITTVSAANTNGQLHQHPSNLQSEYTPKHVHVYTSRDLMYSEPFFFDEPFDVFWVDFEHIA